MNIERLNLAFQRTEGLAGKYYRPPYGHLYNTDTSLLRTVHLVPEMPQIIHSLYTSIIRTPV